MDCIHTPSPDHRWTLASRLPVVTVSREGGVMQGVVSYDVRRHVDNLSVCLDEALIVECES